MLPTKFRFIWPRGFRGENFKKSANQKEELPMVAMFVNGQCLKWTVVQSPNATNILFGRPKAAPN